MMARASSATARVTARLLSSSVAPPIAAVRELYRRGSGRRKVGPGQPRVVSCITGGGGQFFSWLLSEPGASSCLLEGRIPYDKASCVEFLSTHGRSADGIGYCSEAMAVQLASAARDRAIMLTPRVSQWPDAIGVACTATIVSHYTRRGAYRAHVATCTGPDASATAYTHTLVKGHRERSGEDEACALLSLRALAAAAGLDAATALESYGVRLDPSEARSNSVGEVAEGVEAIPSPVTVHDASSSSSASASSLILVQSQPGEEPKAVPMPRAGALPANTMIVPWDDELGTPKQIMAAAGEALSALGVVGDGGGDAAWAEVQAAVLLEAPTADHAAGFFALAQVPRPLENWAVWKSAPPPQQQQETEGQDQKEEEEPPLAPGLPKAPHKHRILRGDLPKGASILISPLAAHDLLASLLGHWDVGDGTVAIAQLISQGGKLVVARAADEAAAAVELAAKMAIEEELPKSLRGAFQFVSDSWYDGQLTNLSDGSPSTDKVDGVYKGGWDLDEKRPEGFGVMRWSNGITYEGRWKEGKYHGYGMKSYSKGGGYAGMWSGGKRSGWGISLYHGKFGYDRWVGSFVDDKPHGKGSMYMLTLGLPGRDIGGDVEEQEKAVPFAFEHGQPVDK